MDSPAGKNQLRAVLLAEDHDVTRFGMKQFLSTQMHIPVVESFPAYPPALAALDGQRFDLAVFDLDLPGLTAPSELQKVRLAWPAMKIVVMSGFDRRDLVLEALAAGVHGYIHKSLPLPEVAKRLAHIMSGEIYVPPFLADLGTQVTTATTWNTTSETGGKPLTQRQLDVLEAMTEGMTNKEIGKKLGLSESTVKLHAAGLFQSIGVKSRSQAVLAGQKYLQKKTR